MTCKRKFKQRRNYLLLLLTAALTAGALYLDVWNYAGGLLLYISSSSAGSSSSQLGLREPEVTKVPRILHLLWCGNRTFDFRHYMSVLSAVKLVLTFGHVALSINDYWHCIV